jgi:hypothetical protein
LSNSPAVNAYYSNTLTENGWTTLNMTNSGNLSELIVSYNWTTDNYPSEGSFWVETPSGMQFMLAGGQTTGNYTVNNTSVSGQELQGTWKFWIEDSYGDGGHQAKNISLKFVRAIPTGDWLSVNPAEGSIAPGLSGELIVTCDATGMELGVYNGSITILSNDPDQPELVVPVSMTVTINTNLNRPGNLSCNTVLYPNPVADQLHVKSSCHKGNDIEMRIFDMFGRSVHSVENQKVFATNGEMLLDVSHLTSGVYLLTIKGNNIMESYRFIKK